MKENHQSLLKNIPRSHCQGEKELHRMVTGPNVAFLYLPLFMIKRCFFSEAKGITELHLAFTKQLTLLLLNITTL